MLLCVGSHGVGAATLRVATSRARRSGGVLRLLHVAETTTPMGLEEAQQRLDPVAEVARSFGGDSVRVEPVLAFGEVLDQVWSAAPRPHWWCSNDRRWCVWAACDGVRR